MSVLIQTLVLHVPLAIIFTHKNATKNALLKLLIYLQLLLLICAIKLAQQRLLIVTNTNVTLNALTKLLMPLVMFVLLKTQIPPKKSPKLEILQAPPQTRLLL